MNYYESPDHPLTTCFKITKEWDSPIGEITFRLPEWVRKGLIDYVLKRNFTQEEYEQDKNINEYSSSHFYNMLLDADKYKEIEKFKQYMNELIRYYCANAWSVPNIDTIPIQAKSFANFQLSGERTYPHYHNGYDGVIVTYLTIGDEFDIDLNNPHLLVGVLPEEPEEEKRETLWTRNETKTQNEEFEKQGSLILIDPRPSPNYPFNRKAISIQPMVGTSVFHPAYLWHETNTFTGRGIRICIGTNFKISDGSDSNDSLVKLEGVVAQ